MYDLSTCVGIWQGWYAQSGQQLITISISILLSNSKNAMIVWQHMLEVVMVHHNVNTLSVICRLMSSQCDLIPMICIQQIAMHRCRDCFNKVCTPLTSPS